MKSELIEANRIQSGRNKTSGGLWPDSPTKEIETRRGKETSTRHLEWNLIQKEVTWDHTLYPAVHEHILLKRMTVHPRAGKKVSCSWSEVGMAGGGPSFNSLSKLLPPSRGGESLRRSPSSKQRDDYLTSHLQNVECDIPIPGKVEVTWC